MRCMRHTVAVQVAEPRLHSFGVGQPTEEMIEAPVLHHHDNDMLDAGLFRRGKRGVSKVLCEYLSAAAIPSRSPPMPPQ